MMRLERRGKLSRRARSSLQFNGWEPMEGRYPVANICFTSLLGTALLEESDAAAFGRPSSLRNDRNESTNQQAVRVNYGGEHAGPAEASFAGRSGPSLRKADRAEELRLNTQGNNKSTGNWLADEGMLGRNAGADLGHIRNQSWNSIDKGQQALAQIILQDAQDAGLVLGNGRAQNPPVRAPEISQPDSGPFRISASGAGSPASYSHATNSNSLPVAFGTSPPVAVDDEVTIPMGVEYYDIWAKLNDYDPDGGGTDIVWITGQQHGNVQNLDMYPGTKSIIRYLPNPGFRGTDTFQYTIQDDDLMVATATVTVHVEPVISSVKWVAINSPLDTNPNPGGGQRIYPDRDNAGDNREKRTVKLQAWVGATTLQGWQGAPGVTVNFKVFDVDDPSANAGDPHNPNGIIDDETQATDNRGPAGGLQNNAAVTDANGVAEVVFTTSRQAGDNFRAVASIDANDLNGLSALQNDGIKAGIVDAQQNRIPETSGKTVASPMLTVWRRLHVEADSMGVISGNTVTGQIAAIAPGTVADERVVTTSTKIHEDENGRFVQGKFTSGGITYNVVDSTVENIVNNIGDLRLTIVIPPGQQPPAANGDFSLRDDDLLVDGQDVPDPNVSMLTSAMSQAYVTVKYDVGTYQGNVPFVANVSFDNEGPLAWANWDSKNDNKDDFWIAYILAAFQGDRVADYDHRTEPRLLGKTRVDVNAMGGSLIYKETIRDVAEWERLVSGNNTITPTSIEQNAVIHEVGHAVARKAGEPITEFDSFTGTLYRYNPDTIDKIRGNTSRPWGP